MRSFRIIPLVLIMFVLAGCFRQAGDSFEGVEGQNNNNVQPTVAAPSDASATPTTIIIDPNAGDVTPTVEVLATETPETVDAVQIDPIALTATQLVLELTQDAPTIAPPTSIPTIVPTDAPPTLIPTNPPPTLIPDSTPTVVIIQVEPTDASTAIPTPQSQGVPTLLPTATAPTFITPESVEQVGFPTATATLALGDANDAEVPVSGGNGLITPTALPTQVNSECVYIVNSGDNLFRIALNNRVNLGEMLSLNGLTENSIIQPGQEILLPGCTVDESQTDTSTDDSTDLEIVVTDVPAGSIVYTVVNGDTTGSIARRYGVTIADIVDANPDLLNPDVLDIGQELIIPNQN